MSATHAGATAPLLPGFANPVLQSQRAFRIILAAMGEPGRWLELTDDLAPPAGLQVPAALVLLTLVDFDTPVWLPAVSRNGAAGSWLRFHCNCPLVATTAEAAFALIDPSDAGMPALGEFSTGDDRFPDRSATILVQCGSDDSGIPVDLSGPGIASTIRVAPGGLSRSFWLQAIANAGRYPLGADLLLVSATHIMGLPRSTRINGVD